MSRTVALIALHPWIAISTPVISSAKYFIENNYKIDLYVSRKKFLNQYEIPSCLSSSPLFNLIVYLPEKQYSKPYTIFKKLGFKSLFNFSYNAIEFSLKYKNNHYNLAIGYDAMGIEHAYLANKFWKTKLIYHNLEFHEENDVLKKAEISISNKVNLILTQSFIRAKILSELNKCSLNKIKVLYNSSNLKTTLANNNFYTNYFNLKKDKVKVLFTGSITKEHGIEELLEHFHLWKENMVLIIQGWFTDEKIKNMVISYRDKFPTQIFISDKFFDFEHKLEIFNSIDIVLILFLTSSKNHASAGASSGKYYDALMCGKPVIANNILGMKELISEDKSGMVVENLSEITNAVTKIMSNYEFFSSNALKSFEKYNFSKNLNTIVNNLLKEKA